MKITDNREQKLIRYADLHRGEVFMFCREPCIKVTDDEGICLRDGNFVYVNSTEFVEPLKAEVIIG